MKYLLLGASASVVIASALLYNNTSDNTQLSIAPSKPAITATAQPTQTIAEPTTETPTSKATEQPTSDVTETTAAPAPRAKEEEVLPMPTKEVLEVTAELESPAITEAPTTDEPTKPTEPAKSVSFIGLHISKEAVCTGAELTCSIELDGTPDKITWDMGDGTILSGTLISHEYEIAGNYEITAIAMIDGTPVIEKHKEIDVNLTPTVEISHDVELVEYAEPNHIFNCNCDENLTLNWQVDESYFTEDGVVTTMDRTGRHDYSLTAESPEGCSTFAKDNFYVNDKYTLRAPLAFSPNGDGENDTWMPTDLRYGGYEFTLQIVNRQGQVVYTTTDANAGWDGRIAGSGQQAPANTVYVWVAQVKIHGVTRRIGGDLTLIK